MFDNLIVGFDVVKVAVVQVIDVSVVHDGCVAAILTMLMAMMAVDVLEGRHNASFQKSEKLGLTRQFS